MKHQVIFIHGGDPYDSYEQFITALKKRKLDFERLKTKGWRQSLPDKLGPKFEVILPRMPNSLNAKYVEWKIWFEKFIPYMRKEVILGGHSLGGLFLAKYLSENKFPKKIRGIFLIAPPFKGNGGADPMGDFILPKNMNGLKKYESVVHLYHSEDDEIVLPKDFENYLEVLPKAHVKIFKDKGHFIGGKSFPELVRDIKKLV